MRVAMVSTRNDPCGIADYTRRLVAGLSKHAVVDVLSLDAAERAGGDEFYSKLASRAASADIVHVQHEYSFFGGGTAPPEAKRPIGLGSLPWPGPSRFFDLIRSLDVPVVATLHELIDGEKLAWNRRYASLYLMNRLNRYANGLAFGAVDRVITHSDERRARLVATGVAEERIRVIPIGVAPPPSMPPATLARANLGLGDRFVLAIFGFVNWRKGHRHAVELLSRLPEHVVLLIAGDRHPRDTSGYAEDLRCRIHELGLEARVRVTGYLPESEIPSTLAAAHVVLAPYDDMGGSSTSILTAVSAGRPVVAWGWPQIDELQRLLGCFTIVRKGDADELLVRVRELVDSPERLAAAERVTCEAGARWSTDAEAERVAMVYDEAIGKPRSRDQRRRASRWRWRGAARALW